MNLIYNKLLQAKNKGEKLLAVLLDPDKLKIIDIKTTIFKINENEDVFIV